MKDNNRWNPLFPDDDKAVSIRAIEEYLKKLSSCTSSYFNRERAMLRGEMGRYRDFLDQETLPEAPQDPACVLEELSVYFQRAVQWEKAETMINITPPANLLSIAATCFASLFNPNFAQDEPSGWLMTTELAVIKFLAGLVGWDINTAGGVFTFGGKGTNLYAGKIGLTKAVRNVRHTGVGGYNAVSFTNEKSHPCHREVADWLGLGQDGCVVVKTTRNGQLDLEDFEKALWDALSLGKQIACITVNGGTTNEVIVDPIRKVVDIRDRAVAEFHLDYIPHIHVDSVIGWAWLMFASYDFENNPLGMTKIELMKISSMRDKIQEIQYADSFGVDFHKTGFCPYVSSCIMVRQRKDLLALGGKGEPDIREMKLGEYAPFEWSLELTRSSGGPVSAYVALKLFGKQGFQELIYHIFSNGEYIRSLLELEENFEVINPETEGFATLFVILPPRGKKCFQDYIREDRADELLRYNHQFFLFLLEKFERGEIGFRLTFSRSYRPYGSPSKTGCMKIYQSSPVSTKERISEIMQSLFEMKQEYDQTATEFLEKFNAPDDFVYR